MCYMVKQLTLKSSDGVVFNNVDASIAHQSETIKQYMFSDDIILIPCLTGETLGKVVDYCHAHADDDDLKAFDAKFIKVDHYTLIDLYLAAKYLKIEPLIHLTCQRFLTIAGMMRTMTYEEAREIFTGR